MKLAKRIATLLMCTLALASSSVTFPQTTSSRSRRRAASTSFKITEPGYYFQLDRCNACIWPGWQEEFINLFQGKGYPAFVGYASGKDWFSEQSFNTRTSFLKFTRGGDPHAPICIGPIKSEEAATRALRQFPEILDSIVKKDRASGFDSSSRLEHEAGNGYSLGINHIVAFKIPGRIRSIGPETNLPKVFYRRYSVESWGYRIGEGDGATYLTFNVSEDGVGNRPYYRVGQRYYEVEVHTPKGMGEFNGILRNGTVVWFHLERDRTPLSDNRLLRLLERFVSLGKIGIPVDDNEDTIVVNKAQRQIVYSIISYPRLNQYLSKVE